MNKKSVFNVLLIIILLYIVHVSAFSQIELNARLKAMHSVKSNELLYYVEELASPEFEGRLTGSRGFKDAALWVADYFAHWGMKPGGDNGTFLQAFPVSYCIITDGEAYLHIPFENSVIHKRYRFNSEFIPGSMTDSGEVTAEVVYVGYGITAPELDYDDYKNVDVKGKIVLVEREIPNVTEPERDKWVKYSFHQYKIRNAAEHGAAGYLYNYGPIANPNNDFVDGMILTHIGEEAVNDIFAGTGKDPVRIKHELDGLKPLFFNTGKTFTIRNVSTCCLDAEGYNVIGIMEGSDPMLKDEVIIIGGHLDHCGRIIEIFPGANDNASGIAVMMGIAKALIENEIELKRTLVFIGFGGEESGVLGSEYYVNNPVFPLEKTVAMINFDMVGCGNRFGAGAGNTFPELWSYFEKANERWIHRELSASGFSAKGRPRNDAHRFFVKGVPILSFGASGAPTYWHKIEDTPETITPEIMEDLAQLVFMAVTEFVNLPDIDFRK